jgi:uncharacterized membrane protein
VSDSKRDDRRASLATVEPEAEPSPAVSVATDRRPIAAEQLPFPIRGMMAAQSSQFTGPLPPPDMLADYERALPGAGQEILVAFREERAHRHDIEKRELRIGEKTADAFMANARHGTNAALVVSVIALAVAAFCGYIHEAVLGGIIGGVDLVGLATVFIVGRRQDRSPSPALPTPTPEPPSDKLQRVSDPPPSKRSSRR